MKEAVITVQEYHKIIAQKDAEISRLWNVVRELQRAVYGKKSEKRHFDSQDQLPLFSLPLQQEEQVPEIEVQSHKREHRSRKQLPSALPRERFIYEPQESSCTCCGRELSFIGEEVTEELCYQPAKLFIKEHVRIKKACSTCKKGVVTGSLPVHIPLIEKSNIGISLLTHIIIAKYCDGLPLHRLTQIFARQGYEIPRQRLCDWIGHGVFFLEAIVRALWEELKKERYLQADETTIKVHDKKNEGVCHTGYLWGMLGESGVVFHYAPSRAGHVPKELLAGVTNLHLHTDAYAGYNQVFIPEEIYRIGCFAHVRRYFIKCEKTSPKEVQKILSLISKLYQIEKKSKQLQIEQRYQMRQRQAVTVLKTLHKVLKEYSLSLLPKHPLQEAISYTLKQWKELCRYTEDGVFHIDNNAIERQMRPIAVGRKAWLFAGSHVGARRAAVLFSLINTCKIHKINPQQYIADVLMQRACGVKAENLTPLIWKKSRGH